MKLIQFLGLLLPFVLCTPIVCNASAMSSKVSHGTLRALQSDNYVPFPNGTPVRRQFSDGWSFGIITGFNENTEEYSVEWDNGEEMELHSKSTTSTKVAAAGEDYLPYENGTHLRKKKEDGSYEWGTIKGWAADSRTYTIEFDSVENFSDLGEVDIMVNSVANYIPYPEGTPIRKYFDGVGWAFGVVDSFNATEGSYEVTYMDGSQVSTHHMAKMDLKVAAAGEAYEPHPVGTVIREYFEDLEEWGFGEILEFDANTRTYTIVLDGKGIQKNFDVSDLAEIDQMVVGAGGPAYKPYETGVQLAREFEGDGLVFGEITAYDDETQTYTVEWENGESTSEGDLALVDRNVAAAKTGADPNPYPVGTITLSYFEKSDKWYWGEITLYTVSPESWQVKWEDDSTQTFTDEDEVKRMVKHAKHFRPWKIGTPVRTKEDGFWIFGTIANHPEDHTDGFVVDWGENLQQTIYDINILDKMTDAAADEYLAYNQGTRVCKPSSETTSGILRGEIISYDLDEREYRVEWENGHIKSYQDLAHVDRRVNKCIVEGLETNSSANRTNDGNEKSLFGAYIALATVATFGILVVAYELRVSRRRSEIRASETLNLQKDRAEFSDTLKVVDDVPDPFVDAMLPAIA